MHQFVIITSPMHAALPPYSGATSRSGGFCTVLQSEQLASRPVSSERRFGPLSNQALYEMPMDHVEWRG
jgi:hypothetical protein